MLSESNKSALHFYGTEAIQWDRQNQEKAPTHFFNLQSVL